MKLLSLVRHSIAQEIEDAENDFVRKLTPKGIELAKNIVTKIPKKFFHNAIFISSPAYRAIETAVIFANYAEIEANKIIQHEFLYDFFKEQNFFYFLQEQIPLNDNCWIFGHNPTISSIYRVLRKQPQSMPKCAVAIFETQAKNWLEINHNNTSLVEFLDPKQFKHENNS